LRSRVPALGLVSGTALLWTVPATRMCGWKLVAALQEVVTSASEVETKSMEVVTKSPEVVTQNIEVVNIIPPNHRNQRSASPLHHFCSIFEIGRYYPLPNTSAKKVVEKHSEVVEYSPEVVGNRLVVVEKAFKVVEKYPVVVDISPYPQCPQHRLAWIWIWRCVHDEKTAKPLQRYQPLRFSPVFTRIVTSSGCSPIS